ncbi:MAG: heavy metal-binding domain-containing protein, partial [Bacteroidales bacterium]|nr:heavy metal-binding domain-containing protein [Bacteroidales bacterium]
MIITTTNNIEGKQIATYLGIVTGEIALSVRLKTFFKRQDPEKKNRSSAYEDALFEAKQIALKQMEERAAKMGANAVIGIGFKINVTAADSYIM